MHEATSGPVCWAYGPLAGAMAAAEEAWALVEAAAPREWRSTSARTFAGALSDVAVQCARVQDVLARAEVEIRAHHAALATARAALDPWAAAR